MSAYEKKEIDYGSIDTWVGNKYTSWDGGRSWVYDTNTHFQHDGKNYYILDGEELTDQANWKLDTMSGYHMTVSDYVTMQVQRQTLAETQAQNQKMYELMQERNAMQQRWLSEEKARLAAEAEKTQQEEDLLAEKERRRLYLASLGRQPTLLTGGDGAEEYAPIKKRTLGAV